MVDFQRARSEEQRERRREVILATATQMLDEMPVAQLGLNELARRVGLAKSNVLRYFESREAVLLELLDQFGRRWIEDLRPLLADTDGDLRARCERVVDAIVETLATSPVLCDLIGAQASILERNISPDAAAHFKRAMIANVLATAALVNAVIPEMDQGQAMKFVGVSQMSAGAVWSHAHPSTAMLTAYARNPDLAALQLDFATTLRELVAVVLRGLVARDPRLDR